MNKLNLLTLNSIFFPISFFFFFSFCTLHLLSQLILERFSCVVSVDLGSFCMFRETPGSELAITFLHYKILTSRRCEEGGARQRGDRLSRGRAGSKAWADGTELPHCSHLSGSTRRFELQVKKAFTEYCRCFLVRFPSCSFL